VTVFQMVIAVALYLSATGWFAYYQASDYNSRLFLIDWHMFWIIWGWFLVLGYLILTFVK